MATQGTLVERSFASTQALTHIGSWEWSPDARGVSWSDELYRIYGLVPQSQEITAEFFLSRVLEEDRAIVQQGIARAIEQGGSFGWSERIRRPDGSVRTLETVGQVYEEGARRVLFGTCRDVTEERERDALLRRAADIFEHVQIGLSIWAVEKSGGADVFRLVALNPAAADIAREDGTVLVGRSFHEIFPYARGGEVERVLRQVAADAERHEALVASSHNPRNPNRSLSIRGFPLSGQRVGLAVLDVTAQAIERRLQVAEHAVLEMVATGAPLAESLTALVLAVEQHSPPVRGSVLLLDVDGTRLRHGAAPSLPEGYQRSIDGSTIGPSAGSCGTAAFLKRPVYTTDIEADPRWERYRELARPHGLRACWSLPILTPEQRVLGTLAFYFTEARAPTTADEALLARAARLAGIAIQRKQMEEQLSDLSDHVEQALEAERTRIAREIHDDLGQSLTALKMDLAWLKRHPPATPAESEAFAAKLDGMSRFTDEVIRRVRQVSSELRPSVLDDLGLVAAIEWQADVFQERTGKPCSVQARCPELVIAPQVATTAFRIFQEALTNVIRHAEARRVDVAVELTEETLLLTIEDDGKGIALPARDSRKSLGLIGIRERAQRLGGHVSIEPREPHGTRVELSIPLPTQERG